MSRRFQFSVRSLLAATAILSLTLAGRHWLLTRGPFIASETVPGGEPMVIRGRMVRFFGPPECQYFLEAICRSHPDDDVNIVGSSRRSWLCIYDIEEPFVPVNRPGSYRLVLQPTWPDAEALRGDLIIEPQPPYIEPQPPYTVEQKEHHEDSPWKTLPPVEKRAKVPFEI